MNEKMKKIWMLSKRIGAWAFVLFAVCVMFLTVFTATTVDRNDRGMLGARFYVVKSDSMSATHFKAGDLIITKPVDPETLKEGDVITFLSQAPDSFGETVTHRIRSETTDEKGRPAFITYGTTTGKDDEVAVSYDCILGKYQGRIPGIGRLCLFLKTTPGYVFCVLIPFLLLILPQGYQCYRLFCQYKAERRALSEEKTETDEDDASDTQ